jgi:hypothetical protein
VSLLSIIINLPLITFFTIFMPFVFLYFFTFKLIQFNWIEGVIRIFIVLIHSGSKIIPGSTVSSTIFLIIAVWIILLKKKKRYLLIALLLHGNTVNAPACFLSGSETQIHFIRTKL